MKSKSVYLLLAGVTLFTILCVLGVWIYRSKQPPVTAPWPGAAQGAFQATSGLSAQILAIRGLSQAKGPDLEHFLMGQPMLLGETNLVFFSGARNEVQDILTAAYEVFRGESDAATPLANAAKLLGPPPNVFNQLRPREFANSRVQLQDHLGHLLQSVIAWNPVRSPARFCQAVLRKSAPAGPSLPLTMGQSRLPLPGWLTSDIWPGLLMNAAIALHTRPMGENQ